MSKRNAGEGSIFQRSDGRWCAQLDLGWQGGKRQRKYIYRATAAEVQDALLKARNDHSQGLPVTVERQTVEQFLRDWLENTVKQYVRPATYVSYEHHIRNHIATEIGRLPLHKLGPQHVRAMLNRKLAAGLSARSAAYLRVILRAALNQALKRQKGQGLVLTETKTERSRRTITLPVQLVTALKAHRIRQLEERLAAGSRWHDGGFVFASNVGTRL